SKWLLYQSLLGLAWGSTSVVNRAAGLACIGTLALVGGLAIAVFTKAVGISCLGRPRSHAAEHAHEGTLGMVAAQVFLCLCCFASGILVPDALRLLEPIASQSVDKQVDMSNIFTIPQAGITLALF